MKTTAANYMTAVEQLWEDMAVYQTELIARPEFYLCLEQESLILQRRIWNNYSF